MFKCEVCGKDMGFFSDKYSYTNDEGESFSCCEHCNIKEETRKQNKLEKEKRRRDSIGENVMIVENQIKNLESTSGAVVFLVIFGILGLFFYGGGIILLIAAAIVSSNRKSKAASLRAQLEAINNTKKKTKTKKQHSTNQKPLDILKNKFAEGIITEAEYKRKKKILQNG